MNSMTGYGEGRARGNHFSVSVEMQSYNHRFLDIQVKLPAQYVRLERNIVSAVSDHLQRGRVEVYVSLQLEPGSASVAIDSDLAGKYWLALKKIRRQLNLENEFPASLLIDLPGVVRFEPGRPSNREFKRCLGNALQTALNGLVSMRKKEGKTISSYLQRHLRSLKRRLARAQMTLENKKSKSPQKREGGQGISIEEEIARLKSHIAQFENTLAQAGPVGKILEFITRELLRETTTLSDKAEDSSVSEQAVYMKMEIENLREQIRNLE